VNLNLTPPEAALLINRLAQEPPFALKIENAPMHVFDENARLFFDVALRQWNDLAPL
jgi:hypothetical protein